MNDLEKPQKPEEIRPEEYAYVVGWLIWCLAGAYFVYQGLAESNSFKLGGGIVAIVMGVSFAAVIVIKPIRRWKKVVGWIWAVLILLILIIVQMVDVIGKRP